MLGTSVCDGDRRRAEALIGRSQRCAPSAPPHRIVDISDRKLSHASTDSLHIAGSMMAYYLPIKKKDRQAMGVEVSALVAVDAFPLPRQCGIGVHPTLATFGKTLGCDPQGLPLTRSVWARSRLAMARRQRSRVMPCVVDTGPYRTLDPASMPHCDFPRPAIHTSCSTLVW